MTIGDILFTLISLMLLILFIASPFFKKSQRASPPDRKPPESPRKRTDNSIIQGFAGAESLVPGTVKISTKISTPAAGTTRLTSAAGEKKPETISVTNRMDSLPFLKKAVIWKEILSPPAALRNGEDYETPDW